MPAESSYRPHPANRRTALLLVNHLRRFTVPVVVRMNREAGLASLLRAVGRHDEQAAGVAHLRVFSLFEQEGD